MTVKMAAHCASLNRAAILVMTPRVLFSACSVRAEFVSKSCSGPELSSRSGWHLTTEDINDAVYRGGHPPFSHAASAFLEAISCVMSMLHTVLVTSGFGYSLLQQMMHTRFCTTTSHHQYSIPTVASRTLASWFCCAMPLCNNCSRNNPQGQQPRKWVQKCLEARS